MKMIYFLICICSLVTCEAQGASILNSAGNFAILAGTTVTNTGNTVVTGDIGVSPGTAITGFPPGIDNGTMHSADGTSAQGEADLQNAYNYLAGLAPTLVLASNEYGGVTFTQGVYKLTSSADLTGMMTLSGPGTFVFQIASSFVVANYAAIDLIGGADANNVYFQVGSSETTGTYAQLEGNIVAFTSISLATGSTLGIGRALAINGAVTLDNNVVSTVASVAPVPEPGSLALGGLTAIGVLACVFMGRKRKTPFAVLQA